LHALRVAGNGVPSLPRDTPAADWRKNGARLASAKIVASLLGLPPDLVFPRAERQRPRPRALWAADLGNAGWQRNLAGSYASLADTLARSGNSPAAREQYAAGRAIIAELTRQHPEQPRWQHDLNWFDYQLALLSANDQARSAPPRPH
jgi:hypothetical protein